ncbi:MAG: response regulator [Planctomycetota bacterium]
MRLQADRSGQTIDDLRAEIDRLRRQNGEMQALLHGSQTAVVSLTSDHHIRSYTQKAAEVYELTDQVIGRPLEDIAHRAKFMPSLPDEIMLCINDPVEDIVALRDGRVVVRRVYPLKCEDGHFDGMIVKFSDATELHTSRQELEATRKRLEMAMEAADMGAFEWNPKTDEAIYDAGLKRLFGIPEDAPESGEVAFDRMHPDDLRSVRDAVAGSMLHGKPYRHEFRVCPDNGQVRWLAGRGVVVMGDDGTKRLIGMNWDITDRKREVEFRRRSEKRLRRVINGATIGIAFADVHGNVETANDAMLHLLGIDRGEFQASGLDWQQMLRSADSKAVSSALQTLHDHGRLESIELSIRRDDGSTHPVVLSALAIDEENEEFVVFMIDLSDRRRFEESLQEARRLAERANETKSEFLANMSHEIRTPMAAIVGYLDILTRSLSNPKDLKCVSIIRHNSRFLLEIINDILDISKIEAGKLAVHKKRFRPENLVADVRSLMDVRAAEKGLDLEIEFDGRIPKTIRSDDKRLKQILVNLIGNAIKFTEVGRVSMKVTREPNQEVLRFDVSDTGIGVEQRKLRKLFDPFTQADTSVSRRYGGTGLGLTISQRLANLLGGEITATSEVGTGSTFTLRIGTGSLRKIPMVTANLDARPNHVAVDKAIAPPTLDQRFLVVDDREDIRFIAQEFLESVGGHVDTACHGQEAIDMYVQAGVNETPYSMILLDMQMPVMDGYEAARRLREIGCTLPIIAATAHAMIGDRQRCIEAGCSDYLTKPLNRDEFLAMVTGHLTDADPSTATQSRRVLIVDDSAEVCEVIEMLLEAEDHIVEKAFDGATTLAKIDSFGPELVLLDLGLPDIDGFEVLRRAKEKASAEGVMFVALTGQSNADEVKAAGFDHHLLKPVDAEELESFVANLGPAN